MTASVAAYEGQIGQAAYASSKGGIRALILPAAREFAQFGIRVLGIAPGIFKTPMMAGMRDDVQKSLAESSRSRNCSGRRKNTPCWRCTWSRTATSMANWFASTAPSAWRRGDEDSRPIGTGTQRADDTFSRISLGATRGGLPCRTRSPMSLPTSLDRFAGLVHARRTRPRPQLHGHRPPNRVAFLRKASRSLASTSFSTLVHRNTAPPERISGMSRTCETLMLDVIFRQHRRVDKLHPHTTNRRSVRGVHAPPIAAHHSVLMFTSSPVRPASHRQLCGGDTLVTRQYCAVGITLSAAAPRLCGAHHIARGQGLRNN